MRVKRGVTARAKHRKIFRFTKGYRGRRKNTVKLGKTAMMKAGAHAYADRRKKKGDFRSLWIIRLNAALKMHGVQYSRFIRQMEEKKVILNRKVLSELAASEPATFDAVVKTVMSR
jgi:large subunit ribosomal protein L20